MKLLLGNKNYSSWSLRPWLVLKHFDIEFEDELLLLNGDGWKQNLFARTPSGFVPVLEDGELVIDETIAIIEYLADAFPEKSIWPADIMLRAKARAASARMHAGFSALRGAAPMNLRATHPGRISLDEVGGNITELEELLCGHLAISKGPFLFGDFCAADAMFAPIAARFKTYALPASSRLQGYFDAILALDAYKIWLADALAESWIVDQDEITFMQGQS